LLNQPNDVYEREAQSASFAAGKMVTGPLPVIQRQTEREFFGPAARGAPADWERRVNAATTSSERAALAQEAVGTSVTVIDRTRESANDESPTPAHLIQFIETERRINYDDNLNNKRSPVDRRLLSRNAGYTLHSDGKHYIVLGRPALNPDDFFDTRTTLNHEFDHIRQATAGSRLQGNESEVDAWTSTFIREFHRDYVLGVQGSVCYVHRIAEYTPLLDYFRRSDVSDSVRDSSVQRIVDYYNTTIRSHPGHSKVFRFWIHRTLRRATEVADLARRLNTALRLGIEPDASLATTRQFDCAGVRDATFPNPPTVEPPTGEARGEAPGGAHRFGLEIGAGVVLPEGQRSAALSLGTRFSLRSDQAIILNPLIGARLLYLPAVGDRSTHLAAAIGEVGLRVQQPLRGVYLDLRAGGYVGLELPTPGPRVEGGPTGAIGLGYRWERLELGAEARWLRDVETGTDRFILVGAGGIRF
jgi:hypothetical protein